MRHNSDAVVGSHRRGLIGLRLIAQVAIWFGGFFASTWRSLVNAMKTPLILVCALVGCTPLVAQLVPVDYRHSGDGLLTFDPSTHLSWLDLTQTFGRSYSQTASELGPGGDFAGFRFATVEEFEALHTSFGLPVAHDGDAIGQDPILTARSLELQSLLGYSTPALSPAYTAYISGGFLLTAEPNLPPRVEDRYFGLLQVIDFVSPAMTDFYRAESYAVEPFSDPSIGSWLVRDFAPVPEPATYAMGAFICMALVVAGRASARSAGALMRREPPTILQ